MNEYTAHYITCKCEMDAEDQYVATVTLNDTLIEERPPVTITAEEPDDQLPHNLVRVFMDAAEYRRVFDEMRHAGMCFKWGTMGPDIAATVLEMWHEYRAKLDDRPPIVRTEAEWEEWMGVVGQAQPSPYIAILCDCWQAIKDGREKLRDARLERRRTNKQTPVRVPTG